MSNVDELEKIFVEHPTYNEMKKDFIKNGLQKSIAKYLEDLGGILSYPSNYNEKEEDKKFYNDMQRFMATRILAEFKEVIANQDFDKSVELLLEEDKGDD